MVRIEDQVRMTLTQALAVSLKLPAESIGGDQRIIAELGAKSVNLVHVIGALEDEFDVEIPFMEFRRRETVDAAVGYVAELLAA